MFTVSRCAARNAEPITRQARDFATSVRHRSTSCAQNALPITLPRRGSAPSAPPHSTAPRQFVRRLNHAKGYLPNAEAVELRKLDSERCEEMFLSLQPGMRKGDARSIEVAVRVLVHKADLNGYRVPAKLEVAGKQEMTGKGGGALTLEIVRQFLDASDQEDAQRARGADGDVAK